MLRLSIILWAGLGLTPLLADTYSIIDLGGPASGGNSINSSGQVAGSGYVINNSGQLAGTGSFQGTGGFSKSLVPHAVLYSGGTMQDLGTLYGGNFSYGYGINDSGQVTGQYSPEGAGHSFAFLYSGGVMKHLPTLGIDSLGAAINNSGQVTGWAVNREDYAAHAFLYSGGTTKDLGTLGGRNSSGSGINESGQVTGSSFITGNSAQHAFLYSGGAMQDLGTLGGSYSKGYGINNAGTVVGSSSTAQSIQHAFIYDTMMHDLNDFLPPDSGWVLSEARDINDAGQITGYGSYNGQSRAFLLSPSFAATPEPSAWLLSLTLIGVVGIVARRAGPRFHH